MILSKKKMIKQPNSEEIITPIKSIDKNKIDFIIYHHPCTDGFASAFVAWLYFRENKNIIYFPAVHNETPIPDVRNRNVLICDFSYKKEILDNMISQANSLLIIDHHKSARKELKNIDDQYKIFDMNHSGASLTWNFFFPGVELPYLIKLIEDRDIWSKKYKETKYFASWFHALKFDNEIYEKYLKDEKLLKKTIEEEGKLYYELNKKNICQAISHLSIKFSKIGDKFYFVAYLNTSILKSDIGNKIFKEYPLIDFSCVYSINDKTDSTYFSLRSMKYHTDVSIVASLFNGGGHKYASGVKIDHIVNTLPGTIYDKNNFYKYVHQHIYTRKLEHDGIIYNIVYLKSSENKKEIGKYLLQTKYIQKINNLNKLKKIHVQNCCIIDNFNKQSKEIKKYHFAAIFDITNNCTNYTIIQNNKKKIVGNTINITYKGIVSELDKTFLIFFINKILNQ